MGSYGGPYKGGAPVEQTAGNPAGRATTTTAVPKVAAPTGAPNFWQRIQVDGVRLAKGAENFAKTTVKQTTGAIKRAPTDVTLAIANPIQRKLGIKQTTPQDLIKNKNAPATLRLGAKAGAKGTLKQTAGDVGQTALLGLPGGKATEVTGAALLKTFGTQGVKDLAEKAGIDIAGKGSIEGATQIAKTKAAQDAFKKATTTVVGRAVKSGAKSGAGFGAFGAAQEASAGGTNKQILKAGEQNAAIGGVAGVAGSLVKTGFKALRGKAPTIEKGTAPKDITPSPVTKLDSRAKARQAMTPTETKLLGPGTGKAEGKGFTMTPSVDTAKAKLSARLITINKQLDSVAQGKKTMSVEDLKALKSEKADIAKNSQIATLENVKAPKVDQEPKAKSAFALNESGAVAPGKAASDIAKIHPAIKDYVEKTSKVNKASGNIQRDAQIHDAENKQRLSDSAKLLKKIGNVSRRDKEAVWNYREAKAAGTELPKLTESQQALHDTTSSIVDATNKNKQELVTLKAPGYSKDSIYDSESGNHRIALGKGSALERFGLGRQKTPLSGRSLRTSTSSAKARVYYAVTDEEGNRSVAAIKNVSVKEGLRNVPKGKFVNAIDENGGRTELGKITPGQLKDGAFKGKDGKTYTIGQAEGKEITRATGQQYVKDPLTSALIDYHETTNALSSARMIENWKSAPEFEDIAIKHGEGVPPKGWKTTKLPQMQGYSFEPKVAEVLDDIYGKIRDKVQAASAINHFLRTTMVAIPIRHNFNEIGFYFTDRGFSSLINPAAYKRGTASLVKAVNDVVNQSEDYRKAVSSGFNFMYTDDKAFSDQIYKQTKGMLDDQATAERLASDMRTTVMNLRQAWNAVQHKGVWFQQDVLNMARINERMASGPLKKGMNLEDAVAQTERFNPQYRVPSRVAGNRAASQILRNNNVLFFGSYHYDQWKALANMLGDAVGKSGVRSAGQAWDKLGAMVLGVYATNALIDKGLQKISGNKNAYTKPFGVLDLPSQLYQLATGQKDISTVLQSQIFPSIGLSTIAQVFENRDFFTGKNIRDPNMPVSYQTKQIGKWLESQLPTSQQVSNVKKGGSVVGGVLAISGARFPANSPQTNDLNSLKYDTLPNVQSQAKKQAQAGDVGGAQRTISQYDRVLLAAAKNALRSAGKPVPDDGTLIKQLKKQQYYYAPKPATINKWKSERPTSIVNKL